MCRNVTKRKCKFNPHSGVKRRFFFVNWILTFKGVFGSLSRQPNMKLEVAVTFETKLFSSVSLIHQH